MTDDELAEWEKRALATTERVVVRPSREVESIQYVPCWVLADVILDMVERIRRAEFARAEWSNRAGEWQQNAKEYARRAEGAEYQLARIAATIEYEGPEDGLADAVKQMRHVALDLGLRVRELERRPR
jgi:hypothetical protein